MENGSTTTCMVMESTLGLTTENMKDNILLIKSMDLESITGLMVEYMKVTGLQVNNMIWEYTEFKKNMKSSLDYGKKGKG